MSPKKPRHTRDDNHEYVDIKKIILFAGPLLVVLLLAAPVIYRITMKLIEQDHEQLVNSNLLAFIVTSTFCAGLLLLTNTYIRQFSNYLTKDCHQLQASSAHQSTFLVKLFAIFTNDSHQSRNNYNANNKGRSSPFYSSSENFDSFGQSDGSGKRKIDTKYFKPKFIIHELMTFWGTTCTVITWGSFYVIGGTVVMSERLAQKVKAKSRTARENSSFNFTGNHNTSASSSSSSSGAARGTGQSDFSFSSPFGGSSDANSMPSSASHRKPPFQRISSWTRKSILSVRKKFSRAIRNNAPQLTTAPANDSSSNIFFFGNTTTNTSS